jgi:predicted DNA-binding protein YlxM (UPF0122 family)
VFTDEQKSDIEKYIKQGYSCSEIMKLYPDIKKYSFKNGFYIIKHNMEK